MLMLKKLNYTQSRLNKYNVKKVYRNLCRIFCHFNEIVH